MDAKQITKIEISGFKSLEKVSLDLNMLNILIGSNGSGKSNFISVFYLLQNIVSGKLQLYVRKNGGPNSFLFFGSKRTEKLSVKFYFGNNGYGFTLVPTTDNRFMFEDEFFFWNMTGERSLGSGHTETAIHSGTGNGIDRFVMPILEGQDWKVYHFHDTSDTALMKQLQSLNDNEEFSADARNLAPFLYRLKEEFPKNYIQIRDAVRLAAPFFDDFILRRDPLNKDMIQLEWKDLSGDIPFHASQLSDGTLRFVCLAVLLLQPEELQPETILIDEPELGLHPYAIQVLASMIKKCTVQRQVIISTQSVELLNEFTADDVIVVNHTKDHSEFQRLHSDQLAYWLDHDYTLGDLWKSNILGGRP